MAVTKEQVLASLRGVASPDGTPLPQTGTLSDVVAGDGKVFFSITVDAGEVKAWESVRKRAEEAVRALPGVQSALVALTAERRAGAGPAPQGAAPAPAGAAHAPRELPVADPPRACQGSPRSSRWRSAKAASASRPRRSISRSALPRSASIGILDADIYGPSLPKLLAIKERPQTLGGTRLKPITVMGSPSCRSAS
jgi:ATP-binding protein involved in chromosome partitioning